MRVRIAPESVRLCPDEKWVNEEWSISMSENVKPIVRLRTFHYREHLREAHGETVRRAPRSGNISQMDHSFGPVAPRVSISTLSKFQCRGRSIREIGNHRSFFVSFRQTQRHHTCSRAPRGDRPEAARPARALAAASDTAPRGARHGRRLEQVWKV